MKKDTRQKIGFIINPVSGTHRKDYWPDTIHQHIDKDMFDVAVYFTERPGHAFEMACRLVEKGVMYIVAIGGDGTVNEVASALRDTPAVMGIIPCGSGNGLARHLHIPLHMVDALKMLNKPRVVSIDYGLVNDKPFFCTFGVGFDALISREFSKSHRRGQIKYLSIIAKEFFFYHAKKYSLKVNGEKFKEKALVVTVANSAQYGNNGYIAPLADIADGELDICIIKPFPVTYAVLIAYLLVSKKIHTSKYYRTQRGKKITLKRKCEGNVHLDGDPYMMGKKLKIKVVPQGLKIMVGENFKELPR